MINIQTKREEGFTLIELLVVVAILGILAAVGIPQYQGYQAQAKENATQTNHKNVVRLIQAEFANCSAGATNFIASLAVAVPCTTASEVTLATAVETYAAAGDQNWTNPYDSADAAVDDGAAGAVVGVTYVTGDATANTITVTTLTVTGGTALSDVITRE